MCTFIFCKSTNNTYYYSHLNPEHSISHTFYVVDE